MFGNTRCLLKASPLAFGKDSTIREVSSVATEACVVTGVATNTVSITVDVPSDSIVGIAGSSTVATTTGVLIMLTAIVANDSTELMGVKGGPTTNSTEDVAVESTAVTTTEWVGSVTDEGSEVSVDVITSGSSVKMVLGASFTDERKMPES